MNQSKIAVRYAKALFLTASEKDILEMVRNDIVLIESAINESEAFQAYLSSPVNKPSAKLRFIDHVFGEGRIQPITLNFLRLIVHNNRSAHIPDVVRYFIYLYRKQRRIKSALFTLSTEPSQEIQKRIAEVLKNIYKTEIDLQVAMDSSLIGGFVLRVEDQQYDASVSSALKKMRSNLLQKN
jgi:F-type H+-transporting ATPase subunit delta